MTRPSRKPRGRLRALALALVPALFGAAAAQNASPRPRNDQGRFLVSQRGASVGTEQFTIRRQGAGIEARSQLDYTIGGAPVRQEMTLRLGAGDRMESYLWSQGKSTIAVRYSGGRLSAHYQAGAGAGTDYEFVMPATTAIVDEAGFVLWQLLADRYDFGRGGAQTFSIYAPHTGDPSQVTLRAMAAKKTERELDARTDQAELSLRLDRSGRLLQLTVPAAGLVVARAH